jgi:hypothetical protein
VLLERRTHYAFVLPPSFCCLFSQTVRATTVNNLTKYVFCPITIQQMLNGFLLYLVSVWRPCIWNYWVLVPVALLHSVVPTFWVTSLVRGRMILGLYFITFYRLQWLMTSSPLRSYANYNLRNAARIFMKTGVEQSKFVFSNFVNRRHLREGSLMSYGWKTILQDDIITQNPVLRVIASSLATSASPVLIYIMARWISWDFVWSPYHRSLLQTPNL